MTKGKPWSATDKKHLEDWFRSGVTDVGVLAFYLENKYTEVAVYHMLYSLGLLHKPKGSNQKSLAPSLEIPEELMSVEEALKMLNAALNALSTPGLSKTEITRLRAIVSAAEKYKDMFADYVDYRGVEIELMDLRQKYEVLAKRAKGAASPQSSASANDYGTSKPNGQTSNEP